MFKEYPKIHRLGKDETDGILFGTCYIQEKIDGANTGIWFDGEIKMASRSHEIKDGFNGFCDYVRGHEGIRNLLRDHPEYYMYGEFLVKHTVEYNATSWKKFYLFDIFNLYSSETRLSPLEVEAIAKKYGIESAKIFAEIENPSVEMIKEFLGKSVLGEVGEGVVIKNMNFINKYGVTQYAKLVTEKFIEDNGVTFGGNNRYSESYFELWCTNKYITLERVQKIIQKLQPLIEVKMDMEHTARVINTVYHDMITEEIWEIQKKCPQINFKKLAHLCQRKAAQVYHSILNNSISVADLKIN